MNYFDNSPLDKLADFSSETLYEVWKNQMLQTDDTIPAKVGQMLMTGWNPEKWFSVESTRNAPPEVKTALVRALLWRRDFLVETAHLN